MNNNIQTQDAFATIRELAALAATDNISVVNRDKANDLINNLLLKIIAPAVQKLTAASSGLKL